MEVVVGDEEASKRSSSLASVQPRSFLKTLPRAMIGFLVAVMLDCFVMLSYAILLLATGSNISANYFAGVIITAAISLVYFAFSAIRTENTIELVTAIAVGTCVTLTIFYVRLGFGSIQNVQRSYEMDTGGIPSGTLNALALAWQSVVQGALTVFGYLSYNDFGWRIFKLCGTSLELKRMHEALFRLRAWVQFDFILSLQQCAPRRARGATRARTLSRTRLPLVARASAPALLPSAGRAEASRGVWAGCLRAWRVCGAAGSSLRSSRSFTG